MNANAFDCARCGHPNHKHNKKVWPQWAKACDVCDCPAYQPVYKTKGDNT